MVKRLAFVFTLFLMGASLNAQAPLPLPHELFDEAVELVEVYPVADNIARTFSIYQDDIWLTLNYPDDFSEAAFRGYRRPAVTLPDLSQPPNGVFILLEVTIANDMHIHSPWIVDFANRRFDEMENFCQLTYFDFENPWVYLEQDENVFLCNWRTGETSPLLPVQMTWGESDYGGIDQPDLSPDGRYLVMRGFFSDETTHTYHTRIYSYEIETQTIRFIGIISRFYDFIGFGGWSNAPGFAIVGSYMPEWMPSDSYRGDASISGSLEQPTSASKQIPIRRVLDPPGFEKMYAVMSDGASLGPCFIQFYDAETEQRTDYDTGDLCEYGLIIPDGSGDQLYRSIFPNAAVVRFNYHTGTRRSLFIGEVELIRDISPDGRFAFIALGNSGIVDSHQEPDLNFGFEITPTEYVIMDLQNGHISNRVPASTKWLSTTYLYDEEYLYTLSDDEISSIPFPGSMVLSLFPASEQLIVTTETNELMVYDVVRDTLQPIVSIPDGYQVEVTLLPEEIIRLNFYAFQRPTMTFDIRLP
jgi:hypothetical protein